MVYTRIISGEKQITYKREHVPKYSDCTRYVFEMYSSEDIPSVFRVLYDAMSPEFSLTEYSGTDYCISFKYSVWGESWVLFRWTNVTVSSRHANECVLVFCHRCLTSSIYQDILDTLYETSNNINAANTEKNSPTYLFRT